MEPASLALSVAALPSAFFGIIQTLDTITLAKEYGHDYEITFTNLVLLKARLEIWLESMSEECRNNENFELGDAKTTAGRAVRNALQTLQVIVREGEDFTKKYGLKDVSATPGMAVDPASIQGLMVFSHRARLRQKQGSKTQKAKWAITDKAKFERMLSAIAPIVGSLESLGNTYLQRTMRQREDDMNEMVASATREMKTLLLEAAEAARPQMETNPATGTSDFPAAATKNGHYYLRTLLEGDAQAVYGDIGVVDPNARQHTFSDAKTSGRGQGVFGNMDGDSLEKFFRK